jgi:ribose 5-phosphate isomerase A
MNDKELVAKTAVTQVIRSDNIIVGLGTGSTANYFIDELSQKIKEKSLDIKVVASSTISNRS